MQRVGARHFSESSVCVTLQVDKGVYRVTPDGDGAGSMLRQSEQQQRAGDFARFVIDVPFSSAAPV